MSLRLTETAEDDLSEIWAYLASEASEAVATRFVKSGARPISYRLFLRSSHHDPTLPR